MKKYIAFLILATVLMSVTTGCSKNTNVHKSRMESLYGENQEITSSYDSSLAVKCYNGTFVGIDESDVVSYKGIPFAEPPIGQLRWKNPVAAEASNSIYEAFYFGKSPIQTEKGSMAGSYYEKGEDCLNLNIWTNRSNSAVDKPVMVFIHGGSYSRGSTADPLFDGYNLVKKYDDIILVSLEYRTGIMGFIDFSSVEGGEDYETSGNLGLLDQICALQWIQNNISGFGGNPNNVTIFGESAGGGSVSLLPLIKGSEGLFHRGIIQSGSVVLSYSKEECKELGERLLKASGCSSVTELMQLSEAEIFAANTKMKGKSNFPERDGIVLPTDLYAAYASGAAKDIDMLIGSNADEVRFWIKEMDYYSRVLSGEAMYTLSMPVMYENNIAAISKEDMQYVNAFMKMQSDQKIWNLAEFYNEILFRVPAIVQAAAHSDNGGRTYMYHWTFPGEKKITGAYHTVELPYVFNNPDEGSDPGDSINHDLADTVQDMWVNFARTGNPSTEKYSWEEYDTNTRMTMILGENIGMESNLKGEQREVIEPLLKYNFSGFPAHISFNVPTIHKLIAITVAIISILGVTIIMLIKIVRKRILKAKK